jgi:hypothetical protein
MELKEQLAQMMATLKNNFLQKYALFKSQNNFDSEAFIQETLQFYKQLETFNQKFIVSDAIPSQRILRAQVRREDSGIIG